MFSLYIQIFKGHKIGNSLGRNPLLKKEMLLNPISLISSRSPRTSFPTSSLAELKLIPKISLQTFNTKYYKVQTLYFGKAALYFLAKKF